MVDPVLALSAFLMFAGILVLAFWPGCGVYWRWRRLFWKGELVDVEDALKHVYDCEWLNRTATVESIAGALSITQRCAVGLTQRLHSLGLLTTRDGAQYLTANGRTSALRVVRIHRLWERYLADRTGIHERHWHAYADRWEHTTSPKEMEELHSRLGNPRFDPHGDPIPTANGDVPASRGRTLTELSVGDLGRIVHVEDKPESVYAQLAALGLHPGLTVRLIESSPTRVRIETDGEEYVLAPVVAANLTAVPAADGASGGVPHCRLSDLRVPDGGEVVGISPACRGPQMRRLLDLGFVPGSAVVAQLVNPSGDLTAYLVRGALIALRQDQARLVYITHVSALEEAA